MKENILSQQFLNRGVVSFGKLQFSAYPTPLSATLC
jgi:hypothetical protein